jgi:hypothetical protein
LLDEFRFRVNLYNSWDLRLGHCTRFFGAAAATNALLVKLCTAYRFCVSQSTLSFLSAVGARLQSVNLQTAHSIAAGRLAAAGLDGSIILLEQAVLEHELRNLACSDALAHRIAVRQINRLLSCVRLGAVAATSTCPNLRLYCRVLQSVCVELGRPASFAAQLDRVCIGRHLIENLKRRQKSAAGH